MDEQLKEQVYRLHINGNSEYQIADKLNLNRNTVHKVISKFKGTLEHRLSDIAIFEFEQQFIKTKDAIEIDIQELSDRLEKEEDEDRKLRIRDMIHKRRLDLWLLLGDGHMVLVLKKMKNGIIKTTA